MGININREKCEGCCKDIYFHSKIATCSECGNAVHYNCARKMYKFDHIKDNWTCWKCFSDKPLVYNPFHRVFYNKFTTDYDSSVSEEIDMIKMFSIIARNYQHQKLKILIIHLKMDHYL